MSLRHVAALLLVRRRRLAGRLLLSCISRNTRTPCCSPFVNVITVRAPRVGLLGLHRLGLPQVARRLTLTSLVNPRSEPS